MDSMSAIIIPVFKDFLTSEDSVRSIDGRTFVDVDVLRGISDSVKALSEIVSVAGKDDFGLTSIQDTVEDLLKAVDEVVADKTKE